MNNMNLEFLKRILNQYIFASRKNKIFSKNYFNEVLTKIYKCNQKEFIIFLADADKLGNFNKTYGDKMGDIALDNSLDILIKNMPKNLLLSRIGGDEYIGIIENTSKDNIKKSLKSIKEKLEKDDGKIKINMTFGVANSKDYENLIDLIKDIDKDVLTQKEERGKSKIINYENLEKNIKENVNAFYDCLRLGKNNLVNKDRMLVYKEFIKNSYQQIISANNDKKQNVEDVILANINSKKSIYADDINYQEAVLINDNINSKDIFKKIIKEDKNLTVDVYKKVFYKMLYNSNTKQFNSLYYNTILEKKFNSDMQKHNYNVVYMHTSGLKISNTLIGHDKTDEKLEKLGLEVEEAFDKKQNNNFTFFNKKALHFNSNSAYFFDMNAGNFLLVIPESKMPNKNVESVLEMICQKYKNDFLEINYSMRNTKDFNSMREVIDDAKSDVEMKTNNKFNQIDYSVMTQLMQKYMMNSIDFFRQDQEKFKDKNTQEFFINTFLKTLESVYNKKYVGKSDSKER